MKRRNGREEAERVVGRGGEGRKEGEGGREMKVETEGVEREEREEEE